MADEKPDDVTPAVQDDATGGTPETTDTRNAETDDNQKKLLKSLQEKAARVNAAEKRAAEVEAENERLRRAQSPAVPGPGVDPRQARLRETVAWAQGRDGQGPDPVAGVVVDLATELEMERMRRIELEELDDIEDKATRKKVKQYLTENRKQGRDIDVRAARAEVESESLGEIRAENERLQQALREAQQPTGKAPPTHHREVPASAMKARTLTEDEYAEELKGLPMLERMKRHEQVESGVIKIKR